MRVVSNTPRLPQGQVQADNFARVARQVFPEADDAGVAYLWEPGPGSHLTRATAPCSAFRPGPSAEAERLRRQCFRVVPRHHDAPVLRQASSIDGAGAGGAQRRVPRHRRDVWTGRPPKRAMPAAGALQLGRALR
ncbi:MAG: hypothetical protein WKG07_41235 [Hymenobacter sp.]